MSERIHAPWTDDQVAALNAFQRSGVMHPFTCLGGQHRMRPTLIAEADGWHCPDEACGYRQTWAHGFMARPVALGAVMVWPQREEAPQPNPMAAELKRVRQQLRETEDELAQSRRTVAELASRLEAERIHEAIKRIPAQPPDPDGGLCDPIFREKPVRDAGSIDTFEEPLIVSGPDSVTLTDAVLRGEL